MDVNEEKRGRSSYTGDQVIFLNFRKANAIKCKFKLAEINIRLV